MDQEGGFRIVYFDTLASVLFRVANDFFSHDRSMKTDCTLLSGPYSRASAISLRIIFDFRPHADFHLWLPFDSPERLGIC